jgi:hypothetical protein
MTPTGSSPNRSWTKAPGGSHRTFAFDLDAGHGVASLPRAYPACEARASARSFTYSSTILPLGWSAKPRLTIETANVELESEAAASAGVPAGHHVMLAVRDSGCGMDAVTKARALLHYEGGWKENRPRARNSLRHRHADPWGRLCLLGGLARHSVQGLLPRSHSPPSLGDRTTGEARSANRPY